MTTGTAIYHGERVVFTDFIIFNNKAEYLISYNDSGIVCVWVSQHELSDIRYTISLERV